MPRRSRVLILDVAGNDTPALQEEIRPDELELLTFYSAAAARRYLERTRADLVLADPGATGSIDFLRWARCARPQTPVILLSCEPQLDAALSGLRHGAFDYLSRPVAHDELLATLDRALFAGRRALQSRRVQRLLDFRKASGGQARVATLHGISGFDLVQALERDEFELFFQPRIDARTLALRGFEALLRWNSPQYGWIAPDVFIPIAERTGVIVQLGHRALQRAAAQAARWAREGHASVRVSVNVSARQFADGRLLSAFNEALASDSALAAHMFELEITESALLLRIDEATRTLRAVSAEGASIALDDFGVGYSSLTYLHRFPLNTIKIDRSFTASLPGEARDRAFIGGLLQFARELNLRVVAEGVEREAQIEILQALGCDELQGFWFARPARAENFRTWFRTEVRQP
jgi:EAL domain-containing protein (putative c-di-GMP-specific phosphodiesterase class I)/CheY-like chemotaxis protein